MSGVVEYISASFNSFCSSPCTETGSPLNVVCVPLHPIHRSFKTGCSNTPRTGSPSRNNAIKVPHNGFPVMNDFVPSIGSNTHKYSCFLSSLFFSKPNSIPCSSPNIACDGYRRFTNVRIAVSAFLSATVTGLASFFVSTPREVFRQYFKVSSFAASASSIANAVNSFCNIISSLLSSSSSSSSVVFARVRHRIVARCFPPPLSITRLPR
mmetsp:Transcript_1210/g.3708  ORF Transcript_1210/g.3708 Transcript_1210/m.3708 type:complete len:210 (+) Transcript_1210:446-1075(+)